jgi:hypothetical protein
MLPISTPEAVVCGEGWGAVSPSPSPSPLSATSTCNSPCEPLLAGLGMGAGSFIPYCWAYLVCLPFVLVVLPSLWSSAHSLRSPSSCCGWHWVMPVILSSPHPACVVSSPHCCPCCTLCPPCEWLLMVGVRVLLTWCSSCLLGETACLWLS